MKLLAVHAGEGQRMPFTLYLGPMSEQKEVTLLRIGTDHHQFAAGMMGRQQGKLIDFRELPVEIQRQVARLLPSLVLEDGTRYTGKVEWQMHIIAPGRRDRVRLYSAYAIRHYGEIGSEIGLITGTRQESPQLARISLKRAVRERTGEGNYA